MVQLKTIELKEKALKLLASHFPYEVDGKIVSIENIEITEPEDLTNTEAQLFMKESGQGSLKGYLKGSIVIKDKKTDKIIKKGNHRELFPIYYATERGTYLVNGVEKNIINQLRVGSGVYTTKSPGSNNVKTEYLFLSDNKDKAFVPRININFEPSNMKFEVEIMDKNTYNGIVFFRELGFSDQWISSKIGNDALANALFSKAQMKGGKGLTQIYKDFTGSSKVPTSTEKIREELFSFLAGNAQFGAMGETAIKDSLELDSKSLDKEVLGASLKKTFDVFNNLKPSDNRDDLRFKPVMDENDLMVEFMDKDIQRFKKELNTVDLNSKNLFSELKSTRAFGKELNDEMMQGGTLIQYQDQINPLFLSAIDRRITQLGKRGISGINSTQTKNPRNPKGGSLNRIDPVDTPESGKIGLVEHLSQSAEVKNNRIYIPVLKVKDGKAVDNESNVVKLNPTEEFEKKVAFFDTRYVERDGSTIRFKKDKVPGRYRGQNIDIHVKDLDYVDRRAQDLFGFAANAIPFLAHNDGNRALMGTNMQRQAVELLNREAPLVQASLNGGKETYESFVGETYGKPIRSSVDGTVDSVDKYNINVKDGDGKVHPHKYYNYFPVNQGYITNDIVVKVGDKVKRGDLLAEGWSTKNGQLALGRNARIAYLPYKGYNYEDGIVVSKSFAKDMTAEEVFTRDIEIGNGWVGGVGSNVKNQMREFSIDQNILQRLNSDGLINDGENVKPGDVIGVALVPIEETTDDRLLSLINVKTETGYKLRKIKIDDSSFVEGKVLRKIKLDGQGDVKQIIRVTLVKSKELKLGDKLSGKHGNKGTITKILDDEEMPVAEDGKKIDVIYSPLAVPSRKNLGQLLETNAGLIAEKTGKPFIVNNFDHSEKDRVKRGLKQIGYADGKMKITLKERTVDGKLIDVPTENKVTTGNMYIMKLKHKADDKFQARSNLESDKLVDDKTYMPKKRSGRDQGEKSNPQRFGEMEMRAMQAHGAVWNILESATIKGDGAGDAARRKEIFNAIATGGFDSLDYPGTPESINALKNYMQGMGLKLKPLNGDIEVDSFDETYNNIAVAPIKPDKIIDMIGKKNEIVNNKPFEVISKSVTKSRMSSNNIDKGTVEPTKGGLFDPKIFGDKDDPDRRKKWGYIKLGTPIPNPVFMDDSVNPYSMLTGLTKKQIDSLINQKNVMILDPNQYNGYENEKEKARLSKEFTQNLEKMGLKPGDIVPASKLSDLIKEHGYVPWKAGGEGLQMLLDKVDLKSELQRASEALKTAKKSELDSAYKKYKTIRQLINNDMKASDLMLHYIPVAPTHMRDVIISADNKLIDDNLNKLYKGVLESSNNFKTKKANGFDLMGSGLTPDIAARGTSSVYTNVAKLFGIMKAKDEKGRPLKGLKQNIGEKGGIVRSQMLSKRNDFSGRSVIGVDPNLKMNEIGMPSDMAKFLYRPFIYRELKRQGLAANNLEADALWRKVNTNKDVQRIIQEIADDRPMILNRQPTLHKFGIQAFRPVIKYNEDGEKVRNIQLNPMVVTGYNADFDGDTMAAHVPVTQRSKEEAKNLMMPSSNLINSTDGKLIIEIRHEMALGVYHLTMDKSPVGKELNFNSYAGLKEAYRLGKINAYSNVSLGNYKNKTAGKVLFNLILPPEYRDFKKTWSSKDIQGVLMSMYKEVEERTRGKGQEEKNRGLAGLSMIIDNIKDIGFLAATRSGLSIGISDFKQDKKVKGIIDKEVSKMKKTDLSESDALIMGWKNAEDRIAEMIKEEGFLPKDNPVKIMMDSGARAKADQIRRMAYTVGVGVDISGNMTEPVKSSHLDGLSPQEYFNHSFDSRKGLFDRSVSTQVPGVIAREIWSATQDVRIVSEDCNTSKGIDMKVSNPSFNGRFLSEDLKVDGAVVLKRNDFITDKIQKMLIDRNVEKAKVRTPLMCEASGGACKKCYGTMPGTKTLPRMGEAIGVLASQAMGEPVTQMTMNTFHSGGTSSSATLGAGTIDMILNIKKDPVNSALLATESGKVTKIDRGPAGTFDTITINKKQHKLPHDENGKSKHLRVKEGDTVIAGDFLTYGSLDDVRSGVKIQMHGDENVILTHADPKDLFKIKTKTVGEQGALDYTKEYMTESMSNVFEKTLGAGSIDNRHLETIVGKLTSKVRVLDPGDSNFMIGDTIDRNIADFWNANNTGNLNAKMTPLKLAGKITGKPSGEMYRDKKGNVIISKGELFSASNIPKLMMAGYKDVKVDFKPIKYENQIMSKNQVAVASNSWFGNLGARDVGDRMREGAILGHIDTLDSPRSRQMAGKMLNIAEGSRIKDKDTISSRLYNLFAKDK